MAGINVYGQQIYITLIARRSSIYAGTRFMKRGCNVTVRFALKNFYISVKSVCFERFIETRFGYLK